MTVAFVYGFLLILSLLRHGISGKKTVNLSCCTSLLRRPQCLNITVNSVRLLPVDIYNSLVPLPSYQSYVEDTQNEGGKFTETCCLCFK